MKRLLGLTLAIVLGVVGMAQASSSPSLPTAVRLVNPLGTWTGTLSNPEYVQHVGVITIATLTTANQVTVFQPTGSDLHTVVDSGTITGITKQLPEALDANGNLKVHEQGTANVKLDTNINTDLGKVKVTDGTDVLAVNTDGSLPVQIVSDTTGGTQVSGYFAVSVPAGGTVEIGSYTVTAGKTLFLESFCLTFVGDSLCHLKVNGVNKNTIATNAIMNTVDRYLGNNYSIPESTVLAVSVTNNEASTITAYFSYHGTEK